MSKDVTSAVWFFLDPQPSQEILKRHYPHQQYYSYKMEIKGLSGLISLFRSYLIRHYYEPTILSRIFSVLVQGVPAIPQKNHIRGQPKSLMWGVVRVKLWRF